MLNEMHFNSLQFFFGDNKRVLAEEYRDFPGTLRPVKIR